MATDVIRHAKKSHVGTQTKATRNGHRPSRTPTTWYVTLHMKNGVVRPQLDWSRSMQKGDKVVFMSPDGRPQVKFIAEKAKTSDGEVVMKRPFADEVIVGDGKTAYTIEHSCKALMVCSILLPDNKIADYEGVKAITGKPWPTADEDAGGTHICTGGGTAPVVCT